MRHDKQAARESEFFQTGNANGKKFHLGDLTITIPGTTETIALTQARPKTGDDSFFYATTKKKTRIFLHYTMGWLQGDIDTLTRPGSHISVPFVVSRSGKIVQLFQSAFWSYHVGQGALGGNEAVSSSSVAIELSNIGPLVKNGDKLCTTYDSNDEYCRLDERQAYIELPQAYRGYKYYASFTDEQVAATAKLVRLLTSKYAIPRAFLPESDRHQYLTSEKLKSFSGILSHVNVRKTGKTDIGPAFPWDSLIGKVRA